MTSPGLAEYIAAFRQLRDVTNHADLKAASVWLDPGGDPVVFRGRESAVFCVRSQERKLAVKVFLGDYSDRSHRYAAIATELRRLDLPFIMPFRYANNAINIGNASYPVGISFWAEGEPLHHYITKNLTYAAALRELSVKWLHLCQTMTKAGIAHGDLEPNNILVSEAGLKLVDYDDFYVPDLQSFPSRALGSPNFQHPQRNLLHFGPYLDNFSTWVIYTSLLAVSKDRELWSQVQKDGEQLLFTKADLEDPRSSDLVQQLKNTSERVRQLALTLENLVTYDVPDVPALDPGRVVPASDPKLFATTLQQVPAQTQQLGQASAESQQPSNAAEEESPPARPQSVTTRELPFVTASKPNMFAPLVVAGVLVVIVGLAGVAFWLNRASGPTGPAKVRQAETVTAGKPAVDGTSTTTGTGSQNLEPGKSGQKPGEQEKPVADAEASTPDQSKSSPASAGDATQPQAAGSPDPEPPPSKPPAQRQAQARQSVVDESAVRHPHKPAQEPVYNPPVSYSPSTPRAEEPQPPEEPSSPPTHALQMHPKFSRIQQARTKLDELKGRGIDVTTSRQLLDAVETLAVRGDSPALEAKLQDLEYRLGLRASKD